MTDSQFLLDKNSSHKQDKLLLALIVIVCAAVLITHWPALSAKALSFDDNEYLTENVLVQNPSWASAKQFLTEMLTPSTVGGYYQPLTMISLMMDYAIGGRTDYLVPFHRTSLFLHVANTALIIVFLYMLFGQPWAAAGAGLLFGVHPMTVETMPWIGERKTLLAAFFILWCLIFYVRYARSRNLGFYIASIVAYVLAMMSKPISLPLPALLLLIDFWPLGRLKWKTVWEKLPFFVLGAILGLVAYISQTRTAGTIPPAGYGLQRILLVLCHNIIFYLYKIVWPVNLSSHYAFPKPLDLSNSMVFAGVIGTAILLTVLLISLKWTRALLTGWLFFFIAILPTMQIVGFSNVIASDKFAYVPSIGLLMVLTAFLTWFFTAQKGKAAAYRIAAVIIIFAGLAIAEAAAARNYLVYWRDSVSLYEHMLKFAPNAESLHYNLALAFDTEGRYDDAVREYRRTIHLDPNSYGSYNNLGLMFASQGKTEQAVEEYKQALRIKPDYATAYCNLGSIYLNEDKLDDAIKLFQLALKIKPQFGPGHYNMANVFMKKGDINSAIAEYIETTKCAPTYSPAFYNLGILFQRQQKMDEAISYYRRALAIEPDNPMYLNRVAWLLATQLNFSAKNSDEAITLAQKAATLTNFQNPSILATLSAAYAAKGKLDQAVDTAETALKIAADSNNLNLVSQIQEQLKLYKQAK